MVSIKAGRKNRFFSNAIAKLGFKIEYGQKFIKTQPARCRGVVSIIL